MDIKDEAVSEAGAAFWTRQESTEKAEPPKKEPNGNALVLAARC